MRAVAPSPTRKAPSPRYWSNAPGDCPGVTRSRRKFKARLFALGRYVHLGLYSEWEACRIARVARRMKEDGRLDACSSPAEVRRAVREAAIAPDGRFRDVRPDGSF